MQLLKERREITTDYGERAFSVLLFQDLAVIPLLIAIPFAAGYLPDIEGEGLIGAAKAAGVVIALVLIGRFALNPVLRLVASSGSREAFAATALFIVAATALGVAWAGLSMALGAFLAGVLLAESAYRHQIETDIEPFRGLLLGLFFISIGMRLDLNVIAQFWLQVFGGAMGLVLVKMAVLYALARLFKSDDVDALKIGAALSQGGEFAFVAFTLGSDAGLFTASQATLMAAIVTLSMAATPVLMMLARRMTRKQADDGAGLERAEGGEGHVIIVGFGRMGQIISQVLSASGVRVVTIDRDPGHIRNAERFGFKVYFGDGSRLDTLVTAGALDALAVILAMDVPEAVNQAVAALRERAPNLTILAIAHDRMHEIALRPLGPDVIVRETLESALLLSREALRRMNYADAMIDDFIEQFRELDRQRLLQQMDYGPEGGKDLLHRRFESPAARTKAN
jgi:voltage-gated potassium channel Kch